MFGMIILFDKRRVLLMHNEFNFENMSVKELKKEKEFRIAMINLNNSTGIQSDFDKKIIDDETKQFEKELLEIEKMLRLVD